MYGNMWPPYGMNMNGPSNGVVYVPMPMGNGPKDTSNKPLKPKQMLKQMMDFQKMLGENNPDFQKFIEEQKKKANKPEAPKQATFTVLQVAAIMGSIGIPISMMALYSYIMIAKSVYQAIAPVLK